MLSRSERFLPPREQAENEHAHRERRVPVGWMDVRTERNTETSSETQRDSE